MFWGRETELDQLNELWSLKKASLVVCKGRRRIGKSTLIQHFAKSAARFIEFQGLAPEKGISTSMQLNHFAEQLALISTNPPLKFDDWTQAFWVLDQELKKDKRKTVLFLDEISWMASDDIQFPGKLKTAWDTFLSHHPKLIVVLCGSVSSWIENNIIGKSDFLGRISLTLHINELPLHVISKFWGNTNPNISHFEIIKTACITGGIPRYLIEINPKKTSEENIHRLCFTQGGILLNEFEEIFTDIFESRAKIYRKIVETLTNGRLRFADICKKIKIEPNGVITKYLEDLCQSGFLAKDILYNYKGKPQKLAFYRIRDNYLRFYLKYIAPQKENIVKGLFKYKSLELLPEWPTISGFQFENLILNQLPRLIELLKINPNSIVSAAPYVQRKSSKIKTACQIDLLIQTRNQQLYVCEMKMRKAISTDVIGEVQEKVRALKRPKQFSVRTALIYCGELDASEEINDYFDKIISIAEF